MENSFKTFAEEWANKQLEKENFEKEIKEELIELMILGNLLYHKDSEGNINRIKRLDRNTKFNIKTYGD